MKGLLAMLPPDVPEQFRTIIIKTTKFMPSDRVSLDEVEQILRNFLNTITVTSRYAFMKVIAIAEHIHYQIISSQ